MKRTQTLRVGGKLTDAGRYHSCSLCNRVGIYPTVCGISSTTSFPSVRDYSGGGRDNQPHFAGYGCFTVWQDLGSSLTLPPPLLLCGVPHCVYHCFGSDTPKQYPGPGVPLGNSWNNPHLYLFKVRPISITLRSQSLRCPTRLPEFLAFGHCPSFQ